METVKVSHKSICSGSVHELTGVAWWNYYAQNHDLGHGVAGGSSRVFARPIPLTVGNSTNVKIADLSVINSPFWSK
jgi:galacturan 1,4-alpha-galacturonidase